jgi:hypothetical protein
MAKTKHMPNKLWLPNFVLAKCGCQQNSSTFVTPLELSVVWIPGYPGPPTPGPLQRPIFGPGVKLQPKPSGEDPHEEAPHEENDGQNC